MRRALTDEDFPLSMTGTAIFGKDDPNPLFVSPDAHTSFTLLRLLTIGYEVSAILATSQNAVVVGPAVVALFVSPQEELPLVQNEGWTLDRAVNPS